MKIVFKDREAAARALEEVLPTGKMVKERWKLVAVSKEGVVIASLLNRRRALEIEWLMGENILAPHNAECELGRISESEALVINDKLLEVFDIQYDYVYGEARRKHEERILSKIYHFRKGRPLTNMRGENVLLIDQGAQSGIKLLCAIKTVLAMRPNALYASTPVMPAPVFEAIDPLCDAVFSPYILDDYIDTSCYYSALEPVGDEEIIRILGV